MADKSFEPSFPLPHRVLRDRKVHRIVRRECRPDCISKHVISGNAFRGSEKAQSADRKLLHAADPFGIGAYDVLYSLNKKERWGIANRLASRIGTLQDEEKNIRTSYLKSVIRNYGLIFKDGRWQENNKSFDTEFVSVENGEEIHKFAKRANRYDLLRKPQPSKKLINENIKKKFIGDFSFPEESDLETKIHVVYETATTVWDSRIRDKCDKKVAEAKRRRRNERSKSGKFHFGEKKAYLADLAKMDENELFDEVDENEDVYTAECSPPLFGLGLFVVAKSWTKINSKKAKRRNKDEDQSYLRWLHSPSYMEFVDVNKAEVQYAPWPGEEAREGWDKTTVSWESELLPFIDMPLPEGSTLEEFVSRHAEQCRKVDGMYPEHFISESVNIQKIRLVAGRKDAFFIFQKVNCATNSGNSEVCVRCSVNIKSDASSGPNSFANVAHDRLWNPTRLCPPAAFPAVKCFGDGRDSQESLRDYIHSVEEYVVVEEHSNGNGTVCGICFSEAKAGFALLCGHFFCQICWMIHSRQSLFLGNVPIHCMSNNCSSFLDLDHVITFLPSQQCKKYEKLLWRRISACDGYMRCRKCERIIRFPESTRRPRGLAVCQCRYIWCLGCKQRAHHPVPCQFASNYYQFLEKIGEGEDNPASRAVIHARRCPKCGICYQRAEGCKHMSCPVCGVVFCDLCGTTFIKWEPEHQCHKRGELKIVLFDVALGKHSMLQELFDESLWFYREERKPEGMSKLKKKLAAAGIKFTPSFYVYFAALETLELCEAYLSLDKHCSKEIRRCYSILLFTVQHFRSLVNLRQKFRINEWLIKIEQCIREMMRIGYRTERL